MTAQRYCIPLAVLINLIPCEQAPGFIALAKTLRTLSTFPEIVAALDSLDDHLTFRTFLVGHDVSAADWTLWGSLKGFFDVFVPIRKWS